ncbi:MAG: hypothetical protein H7242_13255, partial [Microbacteriaceae bacterium]|nr:hypothetical protein [Burkholderiaceae bacterium]
MVLKPAPPAAGPARLPAVDRVLAWPAVAELAAQHGGPLVLEAV